VLDLPGVVDPNAVGEFDLFQRFATDAVFRIGVPGARDLMFVENAEFHRFISCGWGQSFRFSSGGRITGWVKM
jgi:hypothetical protein